VTLKADITPYADGPSAGSHVLFRATLPATISGASTDTVIARGSTSGAYSATDVSSNTNYDGYGQYPYRTVLTANLSTTHTSTGNVRSADDKIASFGLTGTSSTAAKIRAGLEKTAAVAGVGTTQNTVSNSVTTTALQVDGTGSSWDLTTATAGNSIYFDAGSATALHDGTSALYSRVSFWIKVDQADDATTAKANFKVSTSTSTSAVGANATAVTVTGLTGASMTDETWYFVDQAIPTLAATHRYIHIETDAITGFANGDDVYIDKLTVYNDSVVLDVAGDLNSTAPVATAFTVKSGGSTVGYGYYTGTSSTGTVRLIPTTDLQAGTSTVTYDIWVSTTALMATDTTATEVLSVRSDFGTPSSAGDFRWYDQAVTATSPITWMNPVGSLTSVSMGY
jgi:hypothetical protein